MTVVKSSKQALQGLQMDILVISVVYFVGHSNEQPDCVRSFTGKLTINSKRLFVES